MVRDYCQNSFNEKQRSRIIHQYRDGFIIDARTSFEQVLSNIDSISALPLEGLP